MKKYIFLILSICVFSLNAQITITPQGTIMGTLSTNYASLSTSDSFVRMKSDGTLLGSPISGWIQPAIVVPTSFNSTLTQKLLSGLVVNGTNTDSVICFNATTKVYTKVARTALTTVSTVDYLQAKLSAAQTKTAVSDIILNTLVSGNIPLNTATGVITLTAGKTYKLEARVYSQNTTGGANDFYFEFVDATSNVGIISGLNGIGGILTTGSFLRNYNPNVSLIYTPSTNQAIKLRITSFSVTSTDIMAATNMTVEQIGLTGVNVLPIANGGTGSSTQNFVDLSSTAQGRLGSLGIGVLIPTSNLHIVGSLATSIRESTVTAITVAAIDRTVIYTITTGMPAFTLPAANTCSGREYRLVNYSATAGSVSSYTGFTGIAATTILAQSSIVVQSNGTTWRRVE